MPDWFSGFLVGTISMLLGVLVQATIRHLHFRKEQLLARYAEFVGIATEEYERAASFEVFISQAKRDDDYFNELETKRHMLRYQLHKLSFEIQLLEKNEELRKKVAALANAQPFEIHMYREHSDISHLHSEKLQRLAEKRRDCFKTCFGMRII